MKIVDQTWGDDEHKKACREFAESCQAGDMIGTYWNLYRRVLKEGADNVWADTFRDNENLPEDVREELRKVCRNMEWGQNIPILNSN